MKSETFSKETVLDLVDIVDPNLRVIGREDKYRFVSSLEQEFDQAVPLQDFYYSHVKDLPDDLNPNFIFSLTLTSLLYKAVQGKINLLKLAKKELDGRGYDEHGNWKGFRKA